MIYGVDCHPQFQAGISIEQIRAEGFDFIAVKVSEATDTYNGIDWLRRGAACGLIGIGYHYLRPGNEAAQAAVFAGQLAAAGGAPGMLDAEALAADGKTPTLSTVGIRRFLDACAGLGVSVPLLYLPRWYWLRMGSPDLSGLPMLWASSYVAGGGFASVLYESVTPSFWAAYGGLPVMVLQFTDKANVAGYVVDADAFPGTREQFVSLIAQGGSDLTPDQDRKLTEIHDEIYRQIPTRAGTGPNPGYTDTTLGYAANSDGFGWRNEQRLVAMQTALWALIQGLVSKGVIDGASLADEYSKLVLPAWPQADNPFSVPPAPPKK